MVRSIAYSPTWHYRYITYQDTTQESKIFMARKYIVSQRNAAYGNATIPHQDADSLFANRQVLQPRRPASLHHNSSPSMPRVLVCALPISMSRLVKAVVQTMPDAQRITKSQPIWFLTFPRYTNIGYLIKSLSLSGLHVLQPVYCSYTCSQSLNRSPDLELLSRGVQIQPT